VLLWLTLDFWDLQFRQALATRRRFSKGGVGSSAALAKAAAVVCADISSQALNSATVLKCYCPPMTMARVSVVKLSSYLIRWEIAIAI
jgi:hypothetical protein